MSLKLCLKSLLAFILGISLVVGLCLATGVSWRILVDIAAHIRWPIFFVMLICSSSFIYLGALKWQLITHNRKEPRPHFYLYYTAHAVLLGQFLPQSVATALCRTAVMRLQQNTSFKHSLLNAVYDLGFDFLIAVILIPASLFQIVFGFSFVLWLMFAALLLLVAGFILVRLPNILSWPIMTKLKYPWLQRLKDERRQGLLAPQLITKIMLLSLARYGLVITQLVLGVSALNIAIPAKIIAYATPLATLPSLIPLTPANLGIAEWSWAYLLTLWHMPAAAGASFALGFRLLILAVQITVSVILSAIYYLPNKK